MSQEELRSPAIEWPAKASAYILDGIIGAGSSGMVFSAKCTARGNAPCAMKAIDLDQSPLKLETLRTETKFMSLCDHPNIVTYHCSFVHGPYLWLVMPRLETSALALIRQLYPSGLKEEVIATLLRDVISSLTYLHEAGQIHRDVKAGNILLDSKGNAKLADFGVSAFMFETDHLGRRMRQTFVGSPLWMAPEVIDRRGYDEKVDIWAVGITAIELAEGSAPNQNAAPMHALVSTLQNPPPQLSDDRTWTRTFRDFVAVCLHKDPARRPSARKLLEHRFLSARTRASASYIVGNLLGPFQALGAQLKPDGAAESRLISANRVLMQEQRAGIPKGVSDWDFPGSLPSSQMDFQPTTQTVLHQSKPIPMAPPSAPVSKPSSPTKAVPAQSVSPPAPAPAPSQPPPGVDAVLDCDAVRLSVEGLIAEVQRLRHDNHVLRTNNEHLKDRIKMFAEMGDQ